MALTKKENEDVCASLTNTMAIRMERDVQVSGFKSIIQLPRVREKQNFLQVS